MGKNLPKIDIGQLGSTWINTGTTLLPPYGKVITAIYFLEGNTPTVLKSEDDTQYVNTEGGSHQGLLKTAVNMAGNLSGTKAIFDSLSGVKVGDQLVMEEIAVGTTITVTELDPDGDNANECNISASVTANDDAVAYFRRLSPGNVGTGGLDLTGVDFDANTTIYGRWTQFKPEATTKGCIVYFGE